MHSYLVTTDHKINDGTFKDSQRYVICIHISFSFIYVCTSKVDPKTGVKSISPPSLMNSTEVQ